MIQPQDSLRNTDRSLSVAWTRMEVHQFMRVKDRNTLELCFMSICLASIPITIVVVIIVLTKSPPKMTKTYKSIIVNYTLTTLFTDVIICFLFDPIPLFPAVACYSKTWLANVDENANYVLLSISLIMLQLTLSSTLVAFLYRLRSLLILSASYSQLNFIYVFVAVYTMALAPVVTILITLHKPRSEMLDVIHNSPQLEFLKNYTSYLATSADDPQFIIFGIIWLCSAFAVVVACILVAVMIAVLLYHKNLCISPECFALQRSFLLQLTLQIMMPVTTTLIPMLVLLSSLHFDVPFGAQFWNLIIAQAVSMHSPLNTITVLLSTRHYRNAMLQMFRGVQKRFVKPIVAFDKSAPCTAHACRF